MMSDLSKDLCWTVIRYVVLPACLRAIVGAVISNVVLTCPRALLER